MEWKPELAILTAADAIQRLRKVDVDRVLCEAPIEHRAELGMYIRKHRRDLAQEVDIVLMALVDEESL